ncbi:related to Phosphoglycerate mutase 2 [Hanseniaspora guilliermondii]|uniref:Phosphoglycerate mutase n=1 Tax=Hanseniaspora guilliermondii TaxID=56406 RepID=A0A1L0D0E0_9ASCO|nr:related to Phosphoglycerate mutase 2 [Hanseniaspora guilliermondii]
MEEQTIELILLRHGQSTLNSKNLFCGWIDPPLTEIGIEQAKSAAREIKKHLISTSKPSVSFCSRLIRTKQTLLTILKELDELSNVNVQETSENVIIEKHKPLSFEKVSTNPSTAMGYNFYSSWRLNERHYGSWQGQNKKKVLNIVGDKEYMQVRRDYEGRPPDVNLDKEMEQKGEVEDKNLPGHDEYEFKEPNRYEKYKMEYQFGDVSLPISESLSDVLTRMTPLLEDFIIPEIINSENKIGMIIAHGSSIRAMLMKLMGLDANEIKGVNIPNGMPMIVKLSYEKGRHNKYNIKFIDRYYLDPELAAKKAEQVKNEGRN